MNPRKGLVLDANILMRAVLGRRVRELLDTHEDTVSFNSPDVCFDDAPLSAHYREMLTRRPAQGKLGTSRCQYESGKTD